MNKFARHGVDLYDDMIAAPSSANTNTNDECSVAGHPPGTAVSNSSPSSGNPPYRQMGNNIHSNHFGRWHQLYIGNLTWWTTDQDISEAVISIGVTDFIEVKFFENRANGQSKGFCVITLGSEQSLQLCMDRLPKKELHGKNPIVTYPSKRALIQFNAQSKTRPVPSPNPGLRNPHPYQHQPQMMTGHNSQGIRPRMPPPGMTPHRLRMPGPPKNWPGPPQQGHLPCGFQHNIWNGPRQNGCPPYSPGHCGPTTGPYAPHVNLAFFQTGGPPHQDTPSPHIPQHRYGPPPTSQVWGWPESNRVSWFRKF